MTKILNAIIIVVMIALIATFIISAVALQNKTDKVISTYSARREELASRQQQIQDMIISLNSTLQSEVGRQQNISAQLGIKFDNVKATPPASVPVTPAVTQAPTPQVVVPTPVKRVVTKAS
jgi:uncharacterized protein YxeA